MFVPPFQSILRALGTDEAKLNAAGAVTIPLELFKLLLSAIALSEELDEQKYLTEYPDVAQGAKSGTGLPPLLHFARNGYFEGRRTFAESFDADYYVEAYPDVARAIERGELKSPEEHYFNWGRFELRAPSESAKREIAVWQSFLRRARNTASA
jgi:hypothetical protein